MSLKSNSSVYSYTSTHMGTAVSGKENNIVSGWSVAIRMSDCNLTGLDRISSTTQAVTATHTHALYHIFRNEMFRKNNFSKYCYTNV